MVQKAVNLESYLRKYFGHSSFRKGQREIITDLLKGESVLGVLPTGMGKSICYQLPAIINDNLTIVVSPLISLMIDQVDQLKAKNISKVACINSLTHKKERQYILNNLKYYKLLYISPELLQTQMMISLLKNIKIDLFVIDEAHCISQWGYEFRPDYLRLGKIRKYLNSPPVLALSATVSKKVHKDIVKVLEIEKRKEHIYPIDRENIIHVVKHLENEEDKLIKLTHILNKLHVPTIIYFSNRSILKQVTKRLQEIYKNRRIAYYHGEMERTDRLMIQQQFINDDLDIICSTSAFGMGIDKNNVRLIIHYHFPKDLESFIQEVGRAGRDGKKSMSIVLYCNRDIHTSLQLIQYDLPNKKDVKLYLRALKLIYKEKNRYSLKDLQSLTNLNDTQLRFLTYHSENHGIIKDHSIFYDESEWQHFLEKICQYSEKRLQYKGKKLREMIDWLEETGCLRRKLYESFESTYKKVKNECCTNCNYDWRQFKVEKNIINDKKDLSWQDKLRYKLKL